MYKSAKDIPLEEFEKLVFESYFFKDNGLETYEDRNRWYEHMVEILVINDRKKEVPIYTEKIIADYEKELEEIIQKYGELSREALRVMSETAYVYYDEIATSDCQNREFYERGLKYSQKFLAVSEKAGNDEFILDAMKLVAKGLSKLGRDEESGEMTAKVLDFLKVFVVKTIAKYGEKSSESFSAMKKLAYEYDENYAESLKIWQRMYEVFVRKGNEEFIDEEEYNWRCDVVISSLAELYNKIGRYEEEAVMREEYVNLPDNFRETYLEEWAEALEKSGRIKESVKVWFKILMANVFEEKLYDFSVLRVISRLVYLYNRLSKNDIESLLSDSELKTMTERLVEIYEGKVESMSEAIEDGDYIEDDIYYKTLNALANAYYLSGQYDKELEIRQEVWNFMDVDSYDDYVEIMSNIADNFHRAGIEDEAQARGFIEEFKGMVTTEHYWDWDWDY